MRRIGWGWNGGHSFSRFRGGGFSGHAQLALQRIRVFPSKMVRSALGDVGCDFQQTSATAPGSSAAAAKSLCAGPWARAGPCTHRTVAAIKSSRPFPGFGIIPAEGGTVNATTTLSIFCCCSGHVVAGAWQGRFGCMATAHWPVPLGQPRAEEQPAALIQTHCRC